MVRPAVGVSVAGDPVSGGLAVPPAGIALLPHYGAALPPSPDLVRGAMWHAETIDLVAQQTDVRLDFLFNQAFTKTAVGVGWSLNLLQSVTSNTTSSIVTVTRGDQTSYGFNYVGVSGGISTYSAANGATSTLTFDGTRFTETYPDGHKLVYTQATTGGNY